MNKSTEKLEDTLKKWCDENLTHGRSYPPNHEPIELNCVPKGNLVYQDGTACSASHAFNDVYLQEDGTYTVYTDCSTIDVEPKHCKNIAEVLDYLLLFCGHDPNSTGDLLLNIIHNYQLNIDKDLVGSYKTYKGGIVPILQNCNDENSALISAIESSIDQWKNNWWCSRIKLNSSTIKSANKS